ncbi:MAG: excinuclease ABC subunit UvrC, partial [Deltaproteobacteria bacterium]|nr:excinuclease ABC subunit UvrC [Deltaproteobacteria bacterium]
KPKYNIRLKDSKTYASIKITVQERFPRILVTRLVKKDGARYFGPYVSAGDVRETVRLIRRIFPLCVCSPSVFRNRVRPCLDYQLGICPAPAVGLISEEAYRELALGAVMFLEGRNTLLIEGLRKKMDEASRAQDFEKAAKVRDRISAIEAMLEKQQVVSHRHVDQDVFALARDGKTMAMQALFIRDGRLAKTASHLFNDSGFSDDEVVSSFITQYYRGGRFVPDEVLSPVRFESIPLLSEWLASISGKKVSIHAPVRGGKKKLVKMDGANAVEALKRAAASYRETAADATLTGLQKRLRLRNYPGRIEAFDISNIGGRFAVGAMASFKNGAPDKGGYRRFRIRGVAGPDDYAMMHEVMSRRFALSGAGALPSLILVDGGKGHLNIALRALSDIGIKGVDAASIAKENRRDERPFAKIRALKGERVYLPNVKDPVLLKDGSGPDLLLRRIRDEAHRFAIAYFRKVKAKADLSSPLDAVHGLGPKRKKALLERFGDTASIMNAGIEDRFSVICYRFTDNR